MSAYLVPQATYYAYFMFTGRNSALGELGCGNVIKS